MNCEICTILDNPSTEEQANRLIEGEHWVATLRRDQEYLGTTFVTARAHREALTDLTPDEDQEFITIRNQLIAAQQKAFGAQVVNVSCLMNLAFDSSGNGSPHVHYHFKPRYAQPVTVDGEVFIDRQFGAYIKEKYPHEVDAPMLATIKKRLLTHIEA